jgi:hypothetical protein
MSVALQPERWKQLRPLLEHALDLDPSARRDYLASLATTAPDLCDDLRRLLARHEHAPGMTAPAAAMLGEALAATVDPDLQQRHVGRRIGAFVLRRLVGSGGMGTVYEAERVEGGFRQRVAIKLIGGMHPDLHERFARERQILAELRHPNIPQLIDGGETDDGMPYFALEYVDGRPLLEYADAVGADFDTRLSLLLRVAEALAYAHRQRVLHRDIKPSNVLVTDEGAVKLLDFGIAKLLDPGLHRTLTRQLLGPMTPEYAAPEQFRGESLTEVTDIYQFGVMTYWLLAGRSPYRVDSSDSFGFARAVCEEPPLPMVVSQPRPAAEASTTGRRRRERQRLADIDRVVRRCLAKPPAARYPDMATLIADLEAVRAAAVPAASRAHARRRRLRVAVVVLLLAATAATLWQGARLAGGWQDPWLEAPALYAMGLERRHLHAARADSEPLIRQAILADARGDLAGAMALLESVHRADPRTPVPAMLLGYWGFALADNETALGWQAQARQRLAAIDDPELDLLLRFVVADATGDYENALRLASALLEVKPGAWFMRLARGHMLNARGLRAAALRELQQIDPPRLDHRKLVDAIADRAALGDIDGARAQLARIEVSENDAGVALLQARLAYSSGDLDEAAAQFARTVEVSRSMARFDIEGRAYLYLGVVEGSRGHLAAAAVALRAAQQRLVERGQLGYGVDAALVLAQLFALQGEAEAMAREIAAARAIHDRQRVGAVDARIELFAARLLGELPATPPGAPEAVATFTAARAALLRGDAARASRLAARAEDQGVTETWLLEEFALLRAELGEATPPLPPIDPPFGPYTRFAGRWALGAGASVVPPPR